MGKGSSRGRWWVGFRERDPKAGVLMERWWEALSIVGLFSSSFSPMNPHVTVDNGLIYLQHRGKENV